jgi:thymidylate synthase ThyX
MRTALDAYYSKLARYPQSSTLPYLLPLAHKRRVLMGMDIAEAAYIIELRSRSQGHFSYRQLAWEMYKAIVEQMPCYSRYIRVTPPESFNPFQR